MQADRLATSRDLTTRLEESRQDAERRALTDELTGLPNRRALRQHLASYCESDSNGDVNLNVLHIDLDNFKNINDSYGHAVGDRVLETAAKIIKSAMRPVDFGTGHASISNLRRIPVDVVKIDRSLISGIDADAGLRRITRSIVDLLNSLEIASLAEGVESGAELAVLEELNCAIVQGYHLARPMPFDELFAWAGARQVARDAEQQGCEQRAAAAD